MAKIPDLYLQARTAEILSAASKCFARKGYRRTSMSDIAAEAGLSVGALYRYFDGKDSLFHALTQQAGEVNREIWAEIEGADAAEQLQAFVQKHLNIAADPKCRMSLALDLRLQDEALDSKIVKGEVERAVQAQYDFICKMLRAAKGLSKVDRNTKAEARALISLLRGAGHQILEDPDFDAPGYQHAVFAILDCWIAGSAAGRGKKSSITKTPGSASK